MENNYEEIYDQTSLIGLVRKAFPTFFNTPSIGNSDLPLESYRLIIIDHQEADGSITPIKEITDGE